MKQQTRWQRCPRNKRTRGERQERNAGRGGVGTEWWSAQRKHDASLRHGVMDGTHRLINQMHWKGRMLRRVFGATLPHALGCREERRVKNVGADARTHRKRDEPGLIWSAWWKMDRKVLTWLALPTTPLLLLLISSSCTPPTLCLFFLYPPCPFSPRYLYLIHTLWSVLSSHYPLFPL